jgi:hypothetical protein
MSWTYLNAAKLVDARRFGLAPSDKFVLTMLADAANDDGLSWVGKLYLQDATSLDRRTVQRIVDRLVKVGLITLTVRGGGAGHSNRYRLDLEVLKRAAYGHPLGKRNGGTAPPFQASETAAAVPERAAPVSRNGGAVPPDPSLTHVDPKGKREARAGARGANPETDRALSGSLPEGFPDAETQREAV